ncbi:23S rRNA (adenine(2503)-C(2))-methyltransferase RlmN [Cellulosilyticum sp. I15G10I2]|uniref:23S rRNA (adenine(2503)-C(2))-methyltransferase RlmN n=1 Tax=Cellulosilyticum sp. I15G10I2 TaxID=1892843 RepID=UPI00085CD237|nr:23S rRNA (adenine(2503)-C(2))-methyltransferase RlmN [Cellulosilyticum sp. I15G10I2]
MNDITSKDLTTLQELMKTYGESAFRAKQLFEWLHKKMIWDYDEMTNIPHGLREKLKQDYPIIQMKIAKKYTSQLDGTIKYLFELQDSHIIEGVLMRYKHGNSICISSQVGCRMGCKFCASTIGGLVRNLSAGEMLAQIYKVQEDIKERISNIVIMGSGEPLEKLDITMQFIQLINSKLGQNIGQRHITLSTCGLVPAIYELADMMMQVTLAVSLHAPTDEKRKRIMPIAHKYLIADILKACRYYTEKTSRRITFEYALIEGENDTEEDARELGKLLSGLLCHVNLIPVNQVEERTYKSSHVSSIEKFMKLLSAYGIQTTLRRKLGSDIDAACGQLRNRYIKERGE